MSINIFSTAKANETQTYNPGIVGVMLYLYKIKRDACKFIWCVYFTHTYLPALSIPSKVSWQEKYPLLPHKQA